MRGGRAFTMRCARITETNQRRNLSSSSAFCKPVYTFLTGYIACVLLFICTRSIVRWPRSNRRILFRILRFPFPVSRWPASFIPFRFSSGISHLKLTLARFPFLISPFPSLDSLSRFTFPISHLSLTCHHLASHAYSRAPPAAAV